MALTLSLTWLYDPDQLARASAILAIVLAIASAATFRADKCFAMIRLDEQRRLIRISVLAHLTLLLGLVATLILSASARDYAVVLTAGAIGVVASSFTSVKVGQLLAAGDADSLAWRNLAVPVLIPLGQVCAASFGGLGAIVGGLAGMFLGATAVARVQVSQLSLSHPLNRTGLRDVMSLAASGALTPLAVLAPTFGLLIAGFPSEAGLLTLALRIGGLPATASGPALGQAFVLKRQGGSLNGRHWSFLAVGGGVWSLLLIAGLSTAEDVVLGGGWAGIASIAVPAALVSYTKVLANPAQALLLASGRALLTLILDVVRLAGCVLIGATVVWIQAPFDVALWLMTALLVTTYAVYFFVSMKD